MKENEISMEVVNPHAAGVDIGSRSHWAAIGQNNDDVQEFGVFNEDLYAMAKWFKENGIKTVAMESTGAYWKPIYNILELLDIDVSVVNAHHMKTVPGRKTDVKDAEWIADSLQHGLL